MYFIKRANHSKNCKKIKNSKQTFTYTATYFSLKFLFQKIWIFEFSDYFRDFSASTLRSSHSPQRLRHRAALQRAMGRRRGARGSVSGRAGRGGTSGINGETILSRFENYLFRRFSGFPSDFGSSWGIQPRSTVPAHVAGLRRASAESRSSGSAPQGRSGGAVGRPGAVQGRLPAPHP